MMVRGFMAVPRPSDIIYAPIELAENIAQGLAEKGHEVTFFGPQGTHIPGVAVETLNMRSLVHNQKEFAELINDSSLQSHYVTCCWDLKFANEMFIRASKGDFDILHFHHPEIALPLLENFKDTPVAFTLHDPIYGWYRDLFDMYKSDNQHYISISNNQRRDAPDLQFTDTVYNGIDTKKYAFYEDNEDYLLFAGRITPEKGVKEAIQVAQATDHRLLIIGPVYEDHKEYFNQYVKPHLNDKILYLGFMDQEQLVRYYQKAKAFLMPVQWEEPFGLVMIEAMACGTPVIGLRRGSVSEVVADKKTGFLCDHVQDMIEAVGKIDQISRQECRRHVEKNFAIKNLVDNYEKAFLQIIKQHQQTLVGPKLVQKQLKNLRSRIQSKLIQGQFDFL